MATHGNDQQLIDVLCLATSTDAVLDLLERSGASPIVMGMVTSEGPHAGSPVHGYALQYDSGSAFIPDLFFVARIVGDDGSLSLDRMHLDEMQGMRIVPLHAAFAELLSARWPAMSATYGQRHHDALNLIASATSPEEVADHDDTNEDVGQPPPPSPVIG